MSNPFGQDPLNTPPCDNFDKDLEGTWNRCIQNKKQDPEKRHMSDYDKHLASMSHFCKMYAM
jgi:hypothetical protein